MTRLHVPLVGGIVLFFSILDILIAVKIEKLVIPDVVQIDNATEIILDCQFSTLKDEGLIVRWFYNGSRIPVYFWKPRTPPKDNGILGGRLDLSFRISPSYHDEGRALRIIRVGPDLSGEYTCSVERNGTDVRQTKAMLVFSPEQELDVKIFKRRTNNHSQTHEYDVKCIARGIFPPPDLILEFKNGVIQKQQQRIWRSNRDESLYDAETSASLVMECYEKLICRLHLPEAGYTSMKEKTIYTKDYCSFSATKKLDMVYIYVALIIYGPMFKLL